MKLSVAAVVAVSFALPGLLAAQSGAVYVEHQKVAAALARNGKLLEAANVKVAAAHRDKAGPLETETGTAILYVTDGQATLAADGRTQQISKGDVAIVPARAARSFKDVSSPISYYLVTVPVLAQGEKSTPTPLTALTIIGREKVEPTFKKAGPLADGPNLKVSGGYRTGPYAPADYRPDVEVHMTEADLFYVIDGDATLITGGTVIGGRPTAPGQIRGSKVEGGESHHLTKGDVMWVPAGVPHWFPEIPTPLSYLLVKVLQ
jgi:quercetin dioxygenase-like cupin family protein